MELQTPEPNRMQVQHCQIQKATKRSIRLLNVSICVQFIIDEVSGRVYDMNCWISKKASVQIFIVVQLISAVTVH